MQCARRRVSLVIATARRALFHTDAGRLRSILRKNSIRSFSIAHTLPKYHKTPVIRHLLIATVFPLHRTPVIRYSETKQFSYITAREVKSFEVGNTVLCAPARLRCILRISTELARM